MNRRKMITTATALLAITVFGYLAKACIDVDFVFGAVLFAFVAISIAVSLACGLLDDANNHLY